VEDNLKPLVEWQPEEGTEGEVLEDITLGSRGENGWRAEDMFKQNRELYNVGSTYKSNLEGYTLQLNRSEMNSQEYK